MLKADMALNALEVELQYIFESAGRASEFLFNGNRVFAEDGDETEWAERGGESVPDGDLKVLEDGRLAFRVAIRCVIAKQHREVTIVLLERIDCSKEFNRKPAPLRDEAVALKFG